LSQGPGWICDLGYCDFEQALKIQKKIHELRVENKIPDTLILVEHPSVLTIGKSGSFDNILISTEVLHEKGIKIYQIERGGDITYHGPGQIVGYPIFYVKTALAGIKAMIKNIASLLIFTLNDFGVEATVKPKFVGVWVGDEKIASIGIAVKHWVTFHGFALNVTTDLTYFDLIRPCGLANVKMTSLEKILQKKIELTEVKERIKVNLEKVFNQRFLIKQIGSGGDLF
jgi:lipoate-protein ligase B